MQFQFLARDDFFKAVLRLQFLTRAELFFYDLQFSRACFVMSALVSRKQLWTVLGLEQYTSWKVSPTCAHAHTHTHTHTHTCTYTYTCACTCVLVFCCVVSCHVVCRASLVGGVCVVWCVVVVVSLFLVLLASYGECIATGKSGVFNDWASSWTVHGMCCPRSILNNR